MYNLKTVYYIVALKIHTKYCHLSSGIKLFTMIVVTNIKIKILCFQRLFFDMWRPFFSNYSFVNTIVAILIITIHF